MSKRTSVAELLNDPVIGTSLEKLCISEKLLETDTLSEKLIGTLRLILKHGDHKDRLSYAQIQAHARASGLSSNLSKSTIKKAKEMVYVDTRSHLRAKVDIIHFIIKNHITPFYLKDMSWESCEAKIHDLIFNLLLPVVLLKQQYILTPKFIKLAPYANKIGKSSEAGCELFITLLRNTDIDLNYRNMQTLALRKTNACLSYDTIKKIERTVLWTHENFHGQHCEHDHVVIDMLRNLRNPINNLKQIKVENLSETITEILVKLLESALTSSAIKKQRLFKF